jgi:hypothetical protein
MWWSKKEPEPPKPDNLLMDAFCDRCKRHLKDELACDVSMEKIDGGIKLVISDALLCRDCVPIVFFGASGLAGKTSEPAGTGKQSEGNNE